MQSGWIKLYRKVTENSMYFSEKFTRMAAWFDLLILANHDEKYLYIRGNRVVVRRGEIGYSKEKLADRWKWSRGKVTRFLNDLETDGMIVQQKSSVINSISIVNYHHYQGDGTTDSTTDSTADSTTDGHQTVHKQECKKKEVFMYKGKNENFLALLENLLSYFHFSEIRNPEKFREGNLFLNTLMKIERIADFEKQFKFYKLYKEKNSDEKKHSFSGFIGTIDEKFLNGGWNSKNWEAELREQEKEKVIKLPPVRGLAR